MKWAWYKIINGAICVQIVWDIYEFCRGGNGWKLTCARTWSTTPQDPIEHSMFHFHPTWQTLSFFLASYKMRFRPILSPVEAVMPVSYMIGTEDG